LLSTFVLLSDNDCHLNLVTSSGSSVRSLQKSQKKNIVWALLCRQSDKNTVSRDRFLVHINTRAISHSRKILPYQFLGLLVKATNRDLGRLIHCIGCLLATSRCVH